MSTPCVLLMRRKIENRRLKGRRAIVLAVGYPGSNQTHFSISKSSEDGLPPFTTNFSFIDYNARQVQDLSDVRQYWDTLPSMYLLLM